MITKLPIRSILITKLYYFHYLHNAVLTQYIMPEICPKILNKQFTDSDYKYLMKEWFKKKD